MFSLDEFLLAKLSKRAEKQGITCPKCGIGEAQEGTDPPRCTGCMASSGGGNDPETEKEE